MEAIAERIVAELKPAAASWDKDVKGKLHEAALTMLTEGMDEDIVEECLHLAITAMQDFYAG